MAIEPIIIDRNTGEQLTGYHIQTDLQRHASREYFDKLEQRQQSSGGERFIFNVMANVPYVSSVLTAAQCGYLLVLSTYIDWDGKLVKSQKDREALTNTDIMQLLRIKERSFFRFMGVCKGYGFILENADGSYSISDGVSFKGSPQDNRVVRSYITTLREMAKENKPENIGVIYKLLPHISKYTNMLVANPEEAERRKRIKLKRQDVAGIAGLSASQITRITTTMIWRGKSVFASVTTPIDGRFYMLNPAIFRRADDVSYDDTTRDIFGI